MCQNRKTKEEFIIDANKVHDSKYDYSLVDYKSNRDKVKIICHIHGVFEQMAKNHISKINRRGCPKCKGGIKSTTNEFIKKANIKHNYLYNYDMTNYINNVIKLRIIY